MEIQNTVGLGLATAPSRNELILDDVLLKMLENPSTLFYGAGVAKGCGGPSGPELFENVKAHFGNDKASDFMGYMSDLIRRNNSNRKEVESYVKEQLGTVSAEAEQKYLFSVPWRAVLTTNFDSLPETIGLTLDQKRSIISKTDLDSEGLVELGRPDLLYCFKLMGSTRFSFPDPGMMTLSSRDMNLTAEGRKRLFNVFKRLASTGQIIYLGYSFDDEVVLDLLTELRFVATETPWGGFAITPTRPRPEILDAMHSIGIEWVQGNLVQFVERAKLLFGEVPVSNAVKLPRLTIHGLPVELDTPTVANILHRFTVLDNSMLEQPGEVNPKAFVEGTDDSFYPYSMQWDFPRKVSTIVGGRRSDKPPPGSLEAFGSRWKGVDSSNNLVGVLVGGAGSGKTVAARRLAFNWRKQGNPVIFVNADTAALDIRALEGLMDEIWRKFLEVASKSKMNVPPPRYLILADDCGPHLEGLIALRDRLKATGKPADILVVARDTDVARDWLLKSQVDVIFELDDTISPAEHSSFVQYFSRIGVLVDETIVKSNLRNPDINKSFFSLVYTCVKGVQSTLKALIEDEFSKLDPQSKNIYGVVAFLQSFVVTPLTSVTSRTAGIGPDTLDAEMRARLGGVLRFREGKEVLSCINRTVADIIAEAAFKTSADRLTILSKIVENVNRDILTEGVMLHDLLADPYRYDEISRSFPLKQVVGLYDTAVGQLPSRPLYIHLAMAQIKADQLDDARVSLNRAMAARMKDFPEREQHVSDVFGRLEQKLAEQAKAKGDMQGSREHLIAAEKHFDAAIISPGMTPQAFQGLAQTYVRLSEIPKDEPEKWELLLAAIQLLTFAENSLGEWTNGEITSLKYEVLAKLEGHLNQKMVDRITNVIGRANGYAFLASREIAHGSPGEALKLVKLGLGIDNTNLWLIRLHLELVKKLQPGDWSARQEAIADYKPLAAKKPDLALTFELAIQEYAYGNRLLGEKLFASLRQRDRDHPLFLSPKEENRWLEDHRPREFQGILVEVPSGRYGRIEASGFPNWIPVPKFEVLFDAHGGETVSFQVIFNMMGPQASRVRAIIR